MPGSQQQVGNELNLSLCAYVSAVHVLIVTFARMPNIGRQLFACAP